MSSIAIEQKPGTTSVLGKYLTFALGPESFGISVLRVREIIRLTETTRVPQLPKHIKGVINLRGRVIPIADMRLRFELDNVQDTERTCIIVVQLTKPDGSDGLMGLIVDAVEEVVNIREGDVEERPHFGVATQSAFILGMAKIKDKVKTLVDIDELISAETLTLIDSKIG